MTDTPRTRRAFLGSGVLAGAGLALPPAPAAARPLREFEFAYEVTRTEAEWRALLPDLEYEILRNGATEWAKTSDLWDDYRDGTFHCKGCDLHLYSSEHRVPLDKGWVFFSHSEPVAVMTDIDPRANYSMEDGATMSLIEVHCRRCGSHLGHILQVDGQVVHCINGLALELRPADA